MTYLLDPLPGHQTVAVFGLGGSGIAAARLLARFHKTIIASDTADESHRAEFEAKLPEGTQLILGHNEIGNATVIVASPGMEPSSPIFETAQSLGIPVLAELEVGALATKKPIVAISGTDGKTTTTTLIGHILDKCHCPNHLGGNVGIPLSEVVLDSDKVDCFVVETSAFQLVFCPNMAPHIFVATNIAEDHSEYFHGDWNRYVSTKRRSLANMNMQDYAILNASDAEMKKWNAYTSAKIVWYGSSLQDIPKDSSSSSSMAAPNFGYAGDHGLYFHFNGSNYSLTFDQLKLRGAHNAMNALAAILAALCMGCAFDDIVASLESYVLPRHRIETVCEHHGIEFIDDSKATNPHAGIAALKTIEKPTALIVGGLDKGLSLHDWMIEMHRNVRAILVIGALSDRFCSEAEALPIGIPMTRCATLEEAVSQGYEIARREGLSVVMLSPGCSSYDMFKSYGQRGDVFANAARSLT